MSDVQQLGHKVHYAGMASVIMHDAGWKSESTFKRHRLLDKLATLLHHDHSDVFLPPVPPPALPCCEVHYYGG